MSPALFLFELLKMGKLTRGHWSCITYLSIEAGKKKTKLKMWKNKTKKHNFKIPGAHVHVYPQTTSKMPVKFQKHLLKAVGGVALTRYFLLYALS